jgi:alkaline phosphatase D
VESQRSPCALLVDLSFDEQFNDAYRIIGPHALETSDFTTRQDLTGLESGSEAFVRRSDLRFQWGGDTAGQGWGINPTFGGMKIYETMRRRNPPFFIHSGDNIYADGPIAASVTAEGGQVWNNIVTPHVAKVAEALDEFRGRYRYNMLDDNVRRFNSEVPQIWAVGRSRSHEQLV